MVISELLTTYWLIALARAAGGPDNPLSWQVLDWLHGEIRKGRLL